MIDDEIEENEDFEKELEQKRHQDMMNVMGKVLSAIKELGKSEKKEENVNGELKLLLDENKKLMQGFYEKLSSIKNVEPPKVNVETNQDKVISAIKEMTISLQPKEVEVVKQEVPERKKNYAVEITDRNFKGFASKIIIKEI